MSVYTVPALNAVDFALTAHTVPSLASPAQGLQAYTVPSLSAVDFALAAYTVPTYMDVGWELLPSGGAFPTQYFGLKCYFNASARDLCLVAEADAPTGVGGVIKIDKNGTLYAVYLVETTDPDASPLRVRTTTGTYAVRLKT